MDKLAQVTGAILKQRYGLGAKSSAQVVGETEGRLVAALSNSAKAGAEIQRAGVEAVKQALGEHSGRLGGRLEAGLEAVSEDLEDALSRVERSVAALKTALDRYAGREDASLPAIAALTEAVRGGLADHMKVLTNVSDEARGAMAALREYAARPLPAPALVRPSEVNLDVLTAPLTELAAANAGLTAMVRELSRQVNQSLSRPVAAPVAVAALTSPEFEITGRDNVGRVKRFKVVQ